MFRPFKWKLSHTTASSGMLSYFGHLWKHFSQGCSGGGWLLHSSPTLGWKDVGQMEDRCRRDGGQMEDSVRTDGGQMQDRLRTDEGKMEDKWRTV